jgi:hypothetical protein
VLLRSICLGGTSLGHSLLIAISYTIGQILNASIGAPLLVMLAGVQSVQQHLLLLPLSLRKRKLVESAMELCFIKAVYLAIVAFLGLQIYVLTEAFLLSSALATLVLSFLCAKRSLLLQRIMPSTAMLLICTLVAVFAFYN